MEGTNSPGPVRPDSVAAPLLVVEIGTTIGADLQPENPTGTKDMINIDVDNDDGDGNDDEESDENTSRTPGSLFRYPTINKEVALKMKAAQTLRPGETPTRWIVTEKCHGCNFQFKFDPESNEVSVYRRNGKLMPGDNFYNWEAHLAQHGDAIRAIGNALGGVVSVFGELVGGVYPGMKSTAACIQEHIYYSPKHEFIMFDIYVYEREAFLEFDEMVALGKQVNLLVVEPWYRGMTLQEILTLDHETEVSRIPALFGLPALPENFIEGFVIRPEAGTLRNGRSKRKFYKWRTQHFLEREVISKKTNVEKVKVTADEAFIERARVMIPTCFEIVRSKEVDTLSVREIGKYIELVYEELLDELASDKAVTPDTAREAKRLIVLFLKEQIKSRTGS